ncbi:MAG: response regulator [Spirochaetaceae bacterium]|nr:MAG: response regulator [Spirochaetaceae bacterium]
MARTKKKERVFSAHEVANICGVVNQTTINWIDKGHLDAFRTPGGQYRVYPDVLARFLQKQNMRLPEELKQILAEQARIDQILIVDDDQEFNNLLKRFMGAQYPEAKVTQAFDGYDAGRAIPESQPDLVFLDINLPGVDGYKLCRHIKEDENLTRPLVVMVTGESDPDAEARSTEAGADAFLVKPIDMDALPDLIGKLSESRATKRE